ncbi:MAG: autotransporter-associated beta strand repeat-containing protein [Planctomycetota bacterium]
MGSSGFTDIGSAITWGSDTSSTGNLKAAIDLSGFTALQNIAAGTPVTFRVVTWGGSGAGGTWYINNITGNDLQIDGALSAAYTPVPISWGVGNGTWDVNTTSNWLTGGGAATNYNQTGPFGDNVTFNQDAGGTVTLNSAVNPGSMMVSATTGTYSFSGAGSINGGMSLVKTGAGVLDLTQLSGGTGNGYTGGTSINGGVVIVSNDNQLGASSGSLSLGGGTLQTGTLDFSSSRTVTLSSTATFNTNGSTTLSGTIAGSGPLVKTGTGTLALTNASSNSYTGGTSITGGILAVTNDNQLGASSGSLNLDGGTLQTGTSAFSSSRTVMLNSTGTFNTNGSTTLSGTIAGSGPLVKSGTGTLALTNANSNSYTGGTNINGGVLAVTNDNQLGDTFGPLSLGGGTLQTNAGIASSRPVTINAPGGTFHTNNFDSTLSGPIQGSGDFAKTGSGTLSLTASSNYSGAMTINAGKLSIGDTGSINSTSSLTIDGPTAAFNYNSSTPYSGRAITFTQGTLGGTGTINRAITVGPNAVLSPGIGVGKQDFTAGMTLGGSGAYTWEISDWLGAAGTGFDQLNISGGNLNMSGLNASSTFKIGITGLNGSVPGLVSNFNSTASRSWTIATTPEITGTFSPSLFNLDTSNFTNLLDGGSFSLSRATNDLLLTFTPGSTVYFWAGNGSTLGGAGTWSAAGDSTAWERSNANGSGGIWDSSKTASFGGSIPTSAVTVSGAVNAGRGIEFTTDGYTLSQGTISLTGASKDANSVSVATGSTAVIATTLAGTNGMAKSGSGSLILAASNTYSGNTAVSGGTLQIGNGGTSGSIAGNASLSNSAVLAFSRSDNTAFSGAISGTGSVTKLAAGTLTLGNTNNSYTGKTAILGGLIAVSGESAFGTNPASFVPDQIALNGGGIQASSGTVSFGNNRGITLGEGGGTLDTNGNAITLSATNPIAGVGSLTKIGLGTLALNASNSSFTGGVTINDGTVQLGHPAALSSANAVAFADNAPITAKLQLQGNSITIGGLSTSSTSAIVENGGSAAVLTVNQPAGPAATYAGVLQNGGSGSLGITKTGAGELALTGVNLYTGTTSINAGTLRLSNNAVASTSPVAITGGNLYLADGATISNPISVSWDVPPSTFSAYYDFGTGTLGAPTSFSNVNAGNLVQGNNNGTTPLITAVSVSSGYAGSSGSNNAGAAARIGELSISESGSAYFEFTLASPMAGQNLSLTSGSFGTRSASTAPQAYTLRSSIDGYTSDLTSGTISANSTWVSKLLSISSPVTGSAASPVTYRLYGYGGSGNAGASTANWRMDDLNLAGSVIAPVAYSPVLGSDITSGTATFAGDVTLSSSVTLSAAAGGTVLFSGKFLDGSNALPTTVTKDGLGLVVLSGTNSHSGGVVVSKGTLLAANGSIGSATGSGPVTVASGASLGNSPTLGGTVGALSTGPVTVSSGGILIPGGLGTVGLPLNVAGNLGLSSSAIVNFDFGSTSKDQILVNGALKLPSTGSITVNLNDLGGLAGADNAKLFGFGSITNWSPFRFQVSGDTAGIYSIVNTGTEIDLKISSGISNLVWSGSSDGTWNVSGATNFNKSGGTSSVFNNNDNVRFDNTGGTNTTINIAAGGLRPGWVEFSNTSAKPYTISGGPINGSTGILITGGGLVTLSNTNGFTGAVAVSNGTLAVSSAGAVGNTSGITLGNSEDSTTSATLQFTAPVSALDRNITLALASSGATRTLDTGSNTVTITGGISGNGGLIVTAGGILNLSTSASTYTGGTTVNSGTIKLLGGPNLLPVGGSVALLTAAQLDLNGNAQTLGALSSSSTLSGIALGTGGSLTFGDSTSRTFAGTISGSGTVTKAGAGSVTLTNTNSFTGTLAVTGGTLAFAKEANVGDPSAAWSLSNGGTLSPSGSISNNRLINLGSGGGVLNVSSAMTLGGKITGPGTLTKIGGNLLSLTGTSNSFGGLTVNAGTVSVVDGSLGNSSTSTVTFLDSSRMLFADNMTVANDFVLSSPSTSTSAYVDFDTSDKNVVLTGNFYASSKLGYEKYGSGKLTLSGTSSPAVGRNYTQVFAGTLEIAQTGLEGANNNINVRAGSLQLTGITYGAQSDHAGIKTPYVSIYDGAALLGSGTASLVDTDLELNIGVASGTLATLASGDVLTISNLVKAYGVVVTAGSGAPMTTAHVSGPGRIVLQASDHLVPVFSSSNSTTTSAGVFGGQWSVDSGILQVGPFAQGAGSSWYGPYGEPLNALGYKTVLTSASTSSFTYTPEPDLPNPVTVKSGGMLAIAVDQANANTNYRNLPDSTGLQDYPANLTPDYLRNPITLSGGTISATGQEVNFPEDGSNQGVPNGTKVIARLGGDFTVTAGTSTIATYDPIGGTGARMVQLVQGSRTLSNSTAAFAAGKTFNYNTTWQAGATLNVDGGTANGGDLKVNGGEFDLSRDSGGTISVGSGATINILHGATVNVGGTELNAALYDTGGSNSVNFTTGEGGGNLVFSRTANLTYRGNIHGSLNLTQNGTGLLLLSGSNDYTGDTTVSSGTLAITSAITSGHALTIGAGATMIYDPSFKMPTSGSPIMFNSASYLSPDTRFAGPADMVAVPEPASLTLLLGLAGCAGAVWLRRRIKP